MGFSAICSALKADLMGISSYSEDFKKFGETGPSSVMPFWMLDLAFSMYIGRDTFRGIRRDEARLKFELLTGEVLLVGVTTDLLIVLDVGVCAFCCWREAEALWLEDGENSSSSCLLADRNGSYLSGENPLQVNFKQKRQKRKRKEKKKNTYEKRSNHLRAILVMVLDDFVPIACQIKALYPLHTESSRKHLWLLTSTTTTTTIPGTGFEFVLLQLMA